MASCCIMLMHALNYRNESSDQMFGLNEILAALVIQCGKHRGFESTLLSLSHIHMRACTVVKESDMINITEEELDHESDSLGA